MRMMWYMIGLSLIIRVHEGPFTIFSLKPTGKEAVILKSEGGLPLQGRKGWYSEGHQGCQPYSVSWPGQVVTWVFALWEIIKLHVIVFCIYVAFHNKIFPHFCTLKDTIKYTYKNTCLQIHERIIHHIITCIPRSCLVHTLEHTGKRWTWISPSFLPDWLSLREQHKLSSHPDGGEKLTKIFFILWVFPTLGPSNQKVHIFLGSRGNKCSHICSKAVAAFLRTFAPAVASAWHWLPLKLGKYFLTSFTIWLKWYLLTAKI